MKMIFRRFAGLFFALLTAAAGMGVPQTALADITLERVTITCGPRCVSDGRREVDLMVQYQEMEAYFRHAYADRRQWANLSDDPMVVVVAILPDARCSTAMASATAGVDSTSSLSNQKTAAENVFTTIKNSMSPTQFTAWIAGMPRQSGTTSFGVPFTNTPVLTVVWSTGYQSYFTLTQGGSGWAVNAHAGWAAPPAGQTPTACPV